MLRVTLTVSQQASLLHKRTAIFCSFQRHFVSNKVCCNNKWRNFFSFLTNVYVKSYILNFYAILFWVLLQSGNFSLLQKQTILLPMPDFLVWNYLLISLNTIARKFELFYPSKIWLLLLTSSVVKSYRII